MELSQERQRIVEVLDYLQTKMHSKKGVREFKQIYKQKKKEAESLYDKALNDRYEEPSRSR